MTTNNMLESLSKEEMLLISGGMAPAVLYAAGFIFGVTPLTVCVVAVVAVAAVGVGVYCGVKGIG